MLTVQTIAFAPEGVSVNIPRPGGLPPLSTSSSHSPPSSPLPVPLPHLPLRLLPPHHLLHSLPLRLQAPLLLVIPRLFLTFLWVASTSSPPFFSSSSSSSSAVLFLLLGVHVYITALWHLALVVSVLEPVYGLVALWKNYHLLKGRVQMGWVLVLCYLFTCGVINGSVTARGRVRLRRPCQDLGLWVLGQIGDHESDPAAGADSVLLCLQESSPDYWTFVYYTLKMADTRKLYDWRRRGWSAKNSWDRGKRCYSSRINYHSARWIRAEECRRRTELGREELGRVARMMGRKEMGWTTKTLSRDPNRREDQRGRDYRGASQ